MKKTEDRRLKTRGSRNKVIKLPREFKRYFWDVEFNGIDIKKNPNFIISRLLQYGNLDAIRWMFRCIKMDKVKKYFKTLGQKQLDSRSYNFWRIILNLPRPKQPLADWRYRHV